MKFEGQILGKMKQQIGKSFVFFVWKGIQVARQYASPSNPRTVAQIEVRDKFTACLAVGQQITLSIINKFWKKFAVKMSAFNAWMSANILSQTWPITSDRWKFSQGSLYIRIPTSALYDDGHQTVDINWDTALLGNQLATDFAVGLVYDNITKQVYVSDIGVLRSAGTLQLEGVSLSDIAQATAYLFFYRGLGTVSEMISTSQDCSVSE